MIDQLIVLFGRFHPVVLHLPIGFLIAVVGGEILSIRGRDILGDGARNFLLGVGVFMSALSIITGLCLSGEGGYSEDLIFQHKWLTIAMSVLVVFAWIFKRKSKSIYQIFLFGAIVLMVLGTHRGGQMTHGRGFLMEAFENFGTEEVVTEEASELVVGELVVEAEVSGFGVEEAKVEIEEMVLVEEESGFVTLRRDKGEGDFLAEDIEMISYENQILPILEKKCYRCHGPDKMKGELRLDSLAGIIKGGEYGAIVRFGEPEKSTMYLSTTYPDDDPDYMPQKGKGLTDSEIDTLHSWILNGKGIGTELETPIEEKIEALSVAIPNRFGVDEQDRFEAEQVITTLRASGVIVDTRNNDFSKLELKYTYVDVFEFDQLAGIANKVSKLDFSRSGIKDEDLERVVLFSSLETLDLSRTRISDAGIAVLGPLSELSVLNLRSTRITDRAVDDLLGFETLKRLYVWDTKFTSEGVQKLRKGLPGTDVIAK